MVDTIETKKKGRISCTEKVAPSLPTRPKWRPWPQDLLAAGVLPDFVLAARHATPTSRIPGLYASFVGPGEKGVTWLADVIRPQSIAIGILRADAAKLCWPVTEAAIRTKCWERRLPIVVEWAVPDISEGDGTSPDEVVAIVAIETGHIRSTICVLVPVSVAIRGCIKACVLRLRIPAHLSLIIESININWTVILVRVVILIRV